EDGIRDFHVTGVQTSALPISVYWGNAEGDLFRASTGGSEPKHLAAGESFDSRLLADQAEVFWVNAQLRSVRAADRRGLHGVRVRSEERRVGEEWGSRGAA